MSLRLDLLKQSTKVWDKERTPFPEIIDNTMRVDFSGCPRKFRNAHLLCRAKSADNVHLVAGGAFAEGNDVFLKTYHGEGPDKGDYDAALIEGARALIKHYGYDEEREAEATWAASPKSCQRMLDAFMSYWLEYHPKTDNFKILMDESDTPMTEFAMKFPLDVNHPVTGKPLEYHIRFDCVRERDGALWGVDDKTTTSLGPSWARQWDTRSQFLGYVYIARAMGLDLRGILVRGTGILKTKITHMQVPVPVSQQLAARWWVQLHKDLQRMVDMWEKGDFDYALNEECNAYGGCAFKDACLAKFEHRALDLLPVRIWNPANPEGSETWTPNPF